ncbi:MAG: putative peptidase [Thermoleophilia bacterium]|nr:putative peptidase [Thermoleophilia bacterium]
MTLEQLQENVRLASFGIPLVLIAFALHEMAHAYAATWFGDPTPARHGRRTLNPIRHLDPIGTVMIVVSMLLFGFPFGFAVTPVDDSQMRRPRLHGGLTSFAGPLVNIILCAISFVLLTVAVNTVSPDAFRLGSSETPLVIEAAYYSMIFNAFLAVFNLLPIPPLDGGRIVGAFMRPDLAREWRKIDEYGMFIILGLALFGGQSFGAFLRFLSDQLIRLVDLIAGASGFGLL